MIKMKNIIHITILILGLCVQVQAKHYFVNPVEGSDWNNGLTWSTAFRSLSRADAVLNATTPGADSVFVMGGTLKFSAYVNWANNWTPKQHKYYFSCGGDEELDPSKRPMEDKDGNGTIEPWEFKFPTVLYFDYSSNASGYAISFTGSPLIDGVTITYKGSYGNSNYLSTVLWNAGSSAVLQNSRIADCEIIYDFKASKTNYGCLLKVTASGKVNSCLIEQNRINITSTFNTQITPLIDIVIPTTVATVGPAVSNVVVRNNFASIDFSSCPETQSNTNLRGMALNISSGNSANTGIFSNCLVFNNEFVFKGNTKFPVATNASLAGTFNAVGKAEIRNCTFANNKLVNMNAGLYLMQGNSLNYLIYNNVFWNNRNLYSATSATNSIGITSDKNQNATSIVSNNITDTVRIGTWGTVLTFANNLPDLSHSNTAVNAPHFIKPTSFVGCSGEGQSVDSMAIKQSVWTLGSQSYLIGKGKRYTDMTTDLAGIAFSEVPSVGAYEFKPPISNAPAFVLEIGKITNNLFISSINQQVKVYNLSGCLLMETLLNVGDEIKLPDNRGVYIINSQSELGSTSKKIQIQ